MVHKLSNHIPVETLRNKTLSAPAHRLLIYMLTQRAGYEPDYAQLAAHMGVKSRETIRVWMNELVEEGYVLRECHSDPYAKHQFYWSFDIYALPRHEFARLNGERIQRKREEERRKQIETDRIIEVELWGSTQAQ